MARSDPPKSVADIIRIREAQLHFDIDGFAVTAQCA
jgi:hypothetical protein